MLNSNEISFLLDLDQFGFSEIKDTQAKQDAKEEIKNFVLEAMLDYIGDQNSPVSGYGKFKKLSKNYAEIKDEFADPVPNLESSGSMLDSLEVKDAKKISQIKFGIFDEDEIGKADGHNNFSGDSKLPMRRFIPNEKEGETFKKDILKGIKEIIDEYL